MASLTVDEGSESIGGDASTLRDASPTDKRPGDEVVVLEISAETVVRPQSSFDEVEFRDGSTNLRRDRPFSASVISRQSVRSTQSRASLSPTLITSDYAAKNLFAYRSGIIEAAVAACKASVLNDLDGEVKGFWLLTEYSESFSAFYILLERSYVSRIRIDHWDLEKEKLILLTTNSLVVIKYDFIALAVGKFKRIFLRSISHLQVGDLTYPPSSVMPPRQHGGLRIHWTKGEPTFAQKWNPFCDDLGYATITHHLLIYNDKEKETATFNVGDLTDSVVGAVGEVRKHDGISEALRVEEGPILIESYASLSSLVYNQSHIGFNMERGGISF